jgi:hypothetical protein
MNTLLAKVVKDAPKAPRSEWQRALENNISAFNGDAIEVSELLCALIGGLDNRYDADTLRDVEHEFDQLKEALEELQRTSDKPDLEDAAYADWVARHDEA